MKKVICLLLTLLISSPAWATPFAWGSNYQGGEADGGGTPGGSDTQVQYNNSGSFGGVSGATTDGTSLAFKNGATSAGYIDFYEDSDNGTNRARLIGPASTADVTLTLPSATGTIALTSDITGGTPGGSDTQIQVNEGSVFQGYAGFTFDTTPGLIVNDAGASTIDVRMEGDNLTHLFFLDASTDSIGINDSDPTEGRFVVKTSTSGGSALYAQNTGGNLNDSAATFYTVNGGAAANVYGRAGFQMNIGDYTTNVWAGMGGFAANNGGTAGVIAYTTAAEADANDFALFVAGGSTIFTNTKIILNDNSLGEIMAFSPGGGSFTFGANSDPGGLLNIDGRANETQLWIQGHSTQTANVVLVEKSDGTDILTVANTGSMRLVPVSAPPGSPASGDMYVDSDSTPDELCFYDGAAWQGISSGTDANCA